MEKVTSGYVIKGRWFPTELAAEQYLLRLEIGRMFGGRDVADALDVVFSQYVLTPKAK